MRERHGESPKRRRGVVFTTKAMILASATTVAMMVVNITLLSDTTPSLRLEASYSPSQRSQITPEETMSSCLLIMDDNHWLVEYLAYHYTTMNLRDMIIAVDPRSTTSPISILDRWKGRINFELWNDSNYFDNYPFNENVTLQDMNLARQQTFLARCMRTLKRRRNHSWVMFTDTDEFITINPRTKQRGHSLHREFSPPIDRPGSILSFLQHEHETRGTSCFSMGRLQFSPDESTFKEVDKDVPFFLNASQFMTLRYLRPADDLVGPKNIVHLSSIPSAFIPTNYTHQHRVIREVCPQAGYTWHSENSLLQVHHYLGTEQQFRFRNDARLELELAGGRNERFDRYRREGSDEAVDILRPWIKAFIKLVGKQEAIRLLEGIGQTEGWESANAHASRFAKASYFVQSSSTGVSDSNSERVFYSVARTDRSGAAVIDMLLAHAYGYANKIRYAGACAVGNQLHHQEKTEQLIRAVGLQDVLRYACPSEANNGVVLDRQVYAVRGNQNFSPSYLEHLRSLVKYPSTKEHSVVVHIRRGDVSPCTKYANRYLPNSHYLQILKEYVPTELSPVSIFSESDSFESFSNFSNCSMYLDTDVSEAWRAIMMADYVVLSKSSFSFVPALLNRNATVIYTPFSQRKLSGWKTVSHDIMDDSIEAVHEMIEKRCSPEGKAAALRKLS